MCISWKYVVIEICLWFEIVNFNLLEDGMWGTPTFSLNSPEEYLEPSRISTMKPIFAKKSILEKKAPLSMVDVSSEG